MNELYAEDVLRTGVWYGDNPLDVDFPDEWNISTHWPQFPPPITDTAIAESLEHPVGQLPIRELCKGKSRPLIIVDDLARPTPTDKVIPVVFQHFRDAGIPLEQVTILLATGTHGPSPIEAVHRKIGEEAAAICRVVIHDCTAPAVKIGRTPFGTPVYVNPEIPKSDFIVGIGGVYPNHSVGFGGGAKLALGVLGIRSTRYLHLMHAVRTPYTVKNEFRSDLEQVARIMGLNTTISLSINANREITRVTNGDHVNYHEELASSIRQIIRSPKPHDADVVISNAYPMDLTLTLIHQKGTTPFRYARPDASKILIASCPEGAGHHGLFPYMNKTRGHRAKMIAGLMMSMTPMRLMKRVSGGVMRKINRRLNKQPQTQTPVAQKSTSATNPIWLYRPGDHSTALPNQFPIYKLKPSWSDIVETVKQEQHGKENLNVVIYPCAALQCVVDMPSKEQEVDTLEHSHA